MGGEIRAVEEELLAGFVSRAIGRRADNAYQLYRKWGGNKPENVPQVQVALEGQTKSLKDKTITKMDPSLKEL